ncbi:MAG: FAD-dependent oxidoreductase [Gammaproteobacteria bacterium]|nr:FAD-dependent oxidoreductase [Gammaproteobacteria bacterium]MYF38289.1 FAD-dependent oxidoreductase [Gammaproteobacteria bacterium]
MDERKVIVIGAGAAGLSAAYALKKRRIPVLLLEAHDKAGGRMAGDTIGEFWVETGAQLFSSGYTIALQLAEELGVGFDRSPVATLSTIYNNRTNRAGVLNLASVFNFRNFKTFLTSGIFSLKGTAQFLKFIRFMRKREDDFRSENYSRLEDLDVEASFTEWSRREFGDEFLEEFCRCAIASITLTTPERISALNGMMMLWATFLDNRHTLLTPNRGVGYFSQQLARACDDVTRLETTVEQVFIEDGKTIGVRTLEDGLLEADAVICATQASTTAKLAPQIPLPTQEFLKSIRYNNAVM